MFKQFSSVVRRINYNHIRDATLVTPHLSLPPSHLWRCAMDNNQYSATKGRVYVSGAQALVRLMVMQRLRDRAAGLKTAGFASGYRGSPLGGLDQTFSQARETLTQHEIHFQPAVNEELAATAVWGTQQLHLVGEANVDGVFALWYGKGPGVDRSVDVLKHMNYAGTSAKGGVLLVAGDDHGAYSSTLPHQSDHVFCAAMIPVLYPSSVSEYIELGLHGWAMSRYSGCVVGFKALADTVESSASIAADPFGVRVRLPEDHSLPKGGLNCRPSSAPLSVQARAQELLMHQHKHSAVLAFARANRLNRTIGHAPNARIGIAASGKSYLDVEEALTLLGIVGDSATRRMIRLFKVSMPWPLEPEGVYGFADGLDCILVVEEKRPVVELQLKTILYDLPDGKRPSVLGKSNECGYVAGSGQATLLPSTADFSVAQIARVIVERFEAILGDPSLWAKLHLQEQTQRMVQLARETPARSAYYCSGCPHNTSTRVPSGSVALAGIGCHIMATSIYPDQNKTFTQMGGEGATWIGQAPFSRVPHVFANLGDGTYFHSGSLAIRAAIAARINITYKILYNDAVAMTGGQPVDGPISVPIITRQLAAEGVQRIAVVTEDVARYANRTGLADGVTIHPRETLDVVQRMLRDIGGVTVLIYDQVCAAEKRRRITRKMLPPPIRRAFINPLVCENCGDCGAQSNCTSIVPIDTTWGRKRAINQTSCNQDFSCVNGFCPSFVTVEGATLRQGVPPADDARLVHATDLPEPTLPAVSAQPFNILVCGIGGTGVITIGAVLGIAAHLEEKSVSVLDMTGMSQKNGAVMCHVRIADQSNVPHAQRIPSGQADLLLGCDMLASAAPDAVDRLCSNRTLVVLNAHEQQPGQALRSPDWNFPRSEVESLLRQATGGGVEIIEATSLARQNLGDEMAANLIILGFAYQRGRVPLHELSLMRAIELNGVAVEMSREAFALGRRAAAGEIGCDGVSASEGMGLVKKPVSLDEMIEQRRAFLQEYQDARYARRYLEFVGHIRHEERAALGGEELTRTVAENLFRLMSYKDEYEVARLYMHDTFRQALSKTFEGDFKLCFHLAPPILSIGHDGAVPAKRAYGPWIMVVFRVLAACRTIRGTRWDIFGYMSERKAERALVRDYMAGIEHTVAVLNRTNYASALKLAHLPEQIRGYGHIKMTHIERTWKEWRTLLAQLKQQDTFDVARAGAGNLHRAISGVSA